MELTKVLRVVGRRTKRASKKPPFTVTKGWKLLNPSSILGPTKTWGRRKLERARVIVEVLVKVSAKTWLKWQLISPRKLYVRKD
jgi:hypothetical protein